MDEKRFWDIYTGVEDAAPNPIADERQFWDVFTATGDPDAYLRYRSRKHGHSPNDPEGAGAPAHRADTAFK